MFSQTGAVPPRYLIEERVTRVKTAPEDVGFMDQNHGSRANGWRETDVPKLARSATDVESFAQSIVW
jgi:hypothetical protein